MRRATSALGPNRNLSEGSKSVASFRPRKSGKEAGTVRHQTLNDRIVPNLSEKARSDYRGYLAREGRANTRDLLSTTILEEEGSSEDGFI